MNNQRRKQIQSVETRLESMASEISDLASQEASVGEGDVAKAEYQQKAEDLVNGWRSIVSDLVGEVDSLKSDEEEAMENVVGEDRKDEMQEAVNSLEGAYEKLEELQNADTAEGFLEKWNESNEDLLSDLQDAQA